MKITLTKRYVFIAYLATVTENIVQRPNPVLHCALNFQREYLFALCFMLLLLVFAIKYAYAELRVV